MEKAHRLTLDQILPGLPPAGFGASVPVVELRDEKSEKGWRTQLGMCWLKMRCQLTYRARTFNDTPEQWEADFS